MGSIPGRKYWQQATVITPVTPVDPVGDLGVGDDTGDASDPIDVTTPYVPPDVRSASSFGLTGATQTMPVSANPFRRPESQQGLGSLAGGWLKMLQQLIGPVTGLLDKFIEDKDQKAKLAHEIGTMAEKTWAGDCPCADCAKYR